jgi:hypothetical protein
LVVVGCGLFFLVAMMIVLLADGRPKKAQSLKKSVDLTGIVEDVNGDVKARINGAGFDPLIAAGASKIGLDLRASMRAWL